MKLYELTEQYETLLEMLLDPEEDEQCILDTLEGVEGEIEVKAENYAKIMRQLEGQAALIKAEEKRLAERRISIDKNIDRLKGSLYGAMKFTGKTKFKTDLFSFNIAKNGGKQPLAVDDVNIDNIPKAFVKVVREIDKDAVSKELEKGNAVTFARLNERGESLRIR